MQTAMGTEGAGPPKEIKPDMAAGTTPTHRGVLGSRGVRYIHEATPRALEKAVIASISDQECVIPRTYGIFRSPVCEKQRAFTVLEVAPHTDAIDYDEIMRIFVRDMAVNHLPHIYHALQWLCQKQGIELPDPPPIRWVDLNGRNGS